MNYRLLRRHLFVALQITVGISLASKSTAQPAEAVGAPPKLATPVRLSAANEPIDVPGYAAPFVADLDRDGRQDLLVGQMNHGLLRFYRNVGTGNQPAYDQHEFVRAGEIRLCVPSGCVVGLTPQVVDFDQDGYPDLLTGSFPEAAIYLFRGNAAGGFEEAEILVNREGQIGLTPRRYNSTVFACDWDQDGDHDLLVGRSTAYLVINEGDNHSPDFAAAVRLEIGGKRLPAGYIAPVFADWDQDGNNDLLIGSGSDLVWYRNRAKQGPPEFESPQVLIAGDTLGAFHDSGPDAERTVPAQRAHSVCVTDYDGDGAVDLLLGDHYFLVRELTEQQQLEYRLASDLRGKFLADFRELAKDAPKLSRDEQITMFRAKLRDLDTLSKVHFVGPMAAQSRLQRHGGVWFYRRL